MRYVYPCILTPDDEEGEGFVVTFPDVPEAITGAKTWEEALKMAQDGLAVALGMYVKSREKIPEPSAAAPGQVLVSVPPVVASKLALYSAMRSQGVTNVALAARLGLSEGAVRRLVDPNHRSHISQVEKALQAVGRTLIVEDKNRPVLRI